MDATAVGYSAKGKRNWFLCELPVKENRRLSLSFIRRYMSKMISDDFLNAIEVPDLKNLEVVDDEEKHLKVQPLLLRPQMRDGQHRSRSSFRRL